MGTEWVRGLPSPSSLPSLQQGHSLSSLLQRCWKMHNEGSCPECSSSGKSLQHVRHWDIYLVDRNPWETRPYWLLELIIPHSVAAFKICEVFGASNSQSTLSWWELLGYWRSSGRTPRLVIEMSNNILIVLTNTDKLQYWIQCLDSSVS